MMIIVTSAVVVTGIPSAPATDIPSTTVAVAMPVVTGTMSIISAATVVATAIIPWIDANRHGDRHGNHGPGAGAVAVRIANGVHFTAAEADHGEHANQGKT
jgi:hypothetical protein